MQMQVCFYCWTDAEMQRNRIRQISNYTCDKTDFFGVHKNPRSRIYHACAWAPLKSLASYSQKVINFLCFKLLYSQERMTNYQSTFCIYSTVYGYTVYKKYKVIHVRIQRSQEENTDVVIWLPTIHLIYWGSIRIKAEDLHCTRSFLFILLNVNWFKRNRDLYAFSAFFFLPCCL